jgi:hypothetical protein
MMKRIVLTGWFVVSVAHATVEIPVDSQGVSPVTAHVVRVDTWRVGSRAECEALRVRLEGSGAVVLGPCFTQGQGERD